MKAYLVSQTVLTGMVIILLCAVGAESLADTDCCHYKVGSKQINLEEFLESCDVTGQTAYGSPPYFDCQSYILGVVESFQPPSQIVDVKHQLCIPKNYETKNLLDVIRDDYGKIWDEYQKNKNEDEYHKVVTYRSAADFIYGSLMKKFGCKK